MPRMHQTAAPATIGNRVVARFLDLLFMGACCSPVFFVIAIYADRAPMALIWGHELEFERAIWAGIAAALAADQALRTVPQTTARRPMNRAMSRSDRDTSGKEFRGADSHLNSVVETSNDVICVPDRDDWQGFHIIDGAYCDRDLMCACPDPRAFETAWL